MIRPARRSEFPEPASSTPRGGGGSKGSASDAALDRQERPFSRGLALPTLRPAQAGDTLIPPAPDSGKMTLWVEETRSGVEGEPKPATASVLVVDDNIKVRIDLRGALHSAGFLVTACDSRVGALKALKSRSFDLVVLDVLLQDGTGLELLRILRDAPETADVPAILLSSDIGLKERARVLGLAVEEVLPKPLNVALLTKCARRLVRFPALDGAPSDKGKLESLRPGDPGKPPADSKRPPADSSRSLPDSTKALAEAMKSSRSGARDDAVRAGEGPPSVGSAWRNQDDVPLGSLLYRALLQSGVAGVIGPVTVARACRRAGVETRSSSPAALMKALPALRDTLRLFLTGEETDRHIKRLETALVGKLSPQ